jgi:hypothetical protein
MLAKLSILETIHIDNIKIYFISSGAPPTGVGGTNAPASAKPAEAGVWVPVIVLHTKTISYSATILLIVAQPSGIAAKHTRFRRGYENYFLV